MKDLGTFGGDNGNAIWLNDEGQVVGTADFPGDVIHHAFIWQDGVKTDLGTVDGDTCTNGVGINSRGQAVGTSTDCHGNVLHLFLWDHGSMLNLSGLILSGSNVIFDDSSFINDRGEIVGNGTPRDLTDAQWAILDSLIPKPIRRTDGRGRPWKDRRAALQTSASLPLRSGH